MPIEKEFDKFMNLAKMLRKIDFFEKSMRILNRIKKKMKVNNIIIGSSPDLLINERQIKIELAYNKCLFENGSVNEAVSKSQYLVDLLENAENNNIPNKNYSILNKIDNKIKSKIYGSLGIYLQKDFNFKNDLILSKKPTFNTKSLFRSSHKHFNMISLSNIYEGSGIEKKPALDARLLNKKINEEPIINHYLSLATNYDKTNFKYWHNYAMFNYKYYKFLIDKKKHCRRKLK